MCGTNGTLLKMPGEYSGGGERRENTRSSMNIQYGFISSNFPSCTLDEDDKLCTKTRSIYLYLIHGPLNVAASFTSWIMHQTQSF